MDAVLGPTMAEVQGLAGGGLLVAALAQGRAIQIFLHTVKDTALGHQLELTHRPKAGVVIGHLQVLGNIRRHRLGDGQIPVLLPVTVEAHPVGPQVGQGQVVVGIGVEPVVLPVAQQGAVVAELSTVAHQVGGGAAQHVLDHHHVGGIHRQVGVQLLAVLVVLEDHQAGVQILQSQVVVGIGTHLPVTQELLGRQIGILTQDQFIALVQQQLNRAGAGSQTGQDVLVAVQNIVLPDNVSSPLKDITVDSVTVLIPLRQLREGGGQVVVANDLRYQGIHGGIHGNLSHIQHRVFGNVHSGLRGIGPVEQLSLLIFLMYQTGLGSAHDRISGDGGGPLGVVGPVEQVTQPIHALDVTVGGFQIAKLVHDLLTGVDHHVPNAVGEARIISAVVGAAPGLYLAGSGHGHGVVHAAADLQGTAAQHSPGVSMSE